MVLVLWRRQRRGLMWSERQKMVRVLLRMKGKKKERMQLMLVW